MVNDLLQLARADDRRPLITVDLARLSRERVDTWSAVAGTAGVAMRTAGLHEPAAVEAMPGAIEQILDNLLDNALNASPVGTTISVSVRSTPDRCELEVADEGAGLTDDAKAQATHRFWRGTTTGEGTGLGLAIVDALARASGADLHLADAPNGGLSVTVSFGRARRAVR
jgi:signal transduction histidine kinase